MDEPDDLFAEAPQDFEQNGPDLFGQDGPDLFGQDGPDLFGQEGPDLFGETPPSPALSEPPSLDVEDPPELEVAIEEVVVTAAPVVAAAAEPVAGASTAAVEPTKPGSDGPHRRSEAEVTASLMEAVDALRQPSVQISRPETPLALYRRYRPDTFADVIGQEHVTDPLQRALINNRVNHAYLFSGPRGCGKTTSARILARCLNCAEGPTPTPCGVCQSCRDLARGGSGSIDVIEIDAASHGGVDDARDLRERAFFAPVHSRYKIYIIDEAHMVTPQGFNALLKVVEEPPPHVRFVFATTEPEKVLGTIRSRTHHYPFRLVPPKTLSAYLASLCEAEGIAVEPTVLPLVVRAGAGSVRDSLSVLDQLLGGAGEDGVSYAQATGLLGYTPDTLLDEIVDAFAAGDAKGVFAAVDKVIEVGQDPRRFAEDLLRRLRDLIIVAAVPEALSSGLVDVAADQGERLTSQANALGPGELTRAAEVIAVGLTEMRGTTAPRLHLELMCARVLLPGADVDDRGLHARLDRLERRLSMGGPVAPASEPAPAAPAAATPQVARESSGRPAPASPRPESGLPARRPAEPDLPSTAAPSQAQTAPGAPTSDSVAVSVNQPQSAEAPAPSRAPAAEAKAPSQAPAAVAGPPSQSPAGDPPYAATPTPSEPSAAGASAPERPAAVSEPAQSPAAPARPEPTPPAQPAPVADASAAPSGALSTTDFRRFWPQILESVKGRRRFTWILLSQNSQVVEVRDGTLTLGLANAGARDSFSRGGSPDVLREAILEVLGVALTITPIVDATAEPAPPAPAEPDPAPVVEAPQRSAAAEEARANLRPTRSVQEQAAEAEELEPSRDDQELAEDAASAEELMVKHLGAELIAEEEAGPV